MHRLTRRIREQARSHIGIHSQPIFTVYPQTLLAKLWITCSPLLAPHAIQAFQP